MRVCGTHGSILSGAHRLVVCPFGCGAEVLQERLGEHTDDECPLRRSPCEACRLPLPLEDHPKHLAESCVRVPRRCTNGVYRMCLLGGEGAGGGGRGGMINVPGNVCTSRPKTKRVTNRTTVTRYVGRDSRDVYVREEMYMHRLQTRKPPAQALPSKAAGSCRGIRYALDTRDGMLLTTIRS